MSFCLIRANRAVRSLLRRRDRGARWLAFLLVGAMPLAGCHTVDLIRVEDIPRLDGYRYGDTLELPTIDGDTYRFDARTIIAIRFLDGRAIKGWYMAIEVQDGTFVGEGPHGIQTRVELSQIALFYVVKKNKALTIALSVTLGVLGIAAIIWLILAIAAANDNSDD